MNYSLISASDYCLNVTDGTHDSPKETDSSYYLITSKHLKEFELDKENAYTISVDDFNKINLRSQVSQYDILFSMIGTVGRTYLELDKQLDYAIKNLGLFSTGGNYKKALWLYYYFKSPRAKEYINQNLRGSTQQYIPLGALRKFPIMVLNDTKHMEKISKILFDIDKKILINKQLIASLERYTQNLFAHWFIDFEFPNEQGQPYKSSGGKMVESELGLIPEEFEVNTITTVAEIIMGQSPKGDTYNYYGEGLPLVNGAADFKEGLITPNKFTTDPKKVALKDDYIFGVRATIGGVTSVDKEYAIGRGAGIARFKDTKFKEFLYFILEDAFNKFEKTSSGSVYLNVSGNDLKKIKFIMPNEAIMSLFSEKVRSMFELLNSLREQNIHLQSLRDSLLPKLLSGEIELPIKETVEN